MKDTTEKKVTESKEEDNGDQTSDVFSNKLTDRPQITYNWKDITKDFFEASSDLHLGELLHDSNFGLFEAMSAIEMMDPKMDAGMVCNQSGRKVLNFEQSIKAGKVKIDNLTFQELIGITDTTLACLVTWLEGHSLAQTVFTNLYTHNPALIEDRILKALTLAVLKMVDIIKDKVIKGAVFEEEDFQTMIYGFKLATDVTDLRVGGMLKEAEEEVTRKVKGTRVRSGEKRSTEVEQEHELAVALQARIKFFRLFYMALLAFGKKEVKAGVEEAQRLIQHARDLLPVLKSSIPLGIHPESPTSESSHPKAPDFPLLMGFEPLVNQRLLPPTFPRYAKIVGREQAIEYFEAFMMRLLTVCDVIHVVGFHSIIDFVSQFSRKCPCVLSRSILQLVILPHNNKKICGVELVQDTLREAVRSFVLPPAVAARSPLYNNSSVKEMVDTLLLHAVRPMSNFLQTFGHNRARQRDKLGQLMEEIANLQDEAEKVDANLHGLMIINEPRRQFKACFGSWVMFHTLRAMMAYILLGFELELYAVHEYHYIYWYLADFLLAWYISTLTRADSMLQEHEAAYLDTAGKGRSNKKKIKKKKARPLEVELLLSQGLQTLCLGYYKAANGFMLEGKIKRPAREFDNERVRFEHRFGAFTSIITPPLVQYDQYYEICDLKLFENQPNRATDIYFTAHNLFMQSALLMEKVTNASSETNTLIRVAKTNSVVMKLLAGGHKRDSKILPSFEFVIHNTFPIIKLK